MGPCPGLRRGGKQGRCIRYRDRSFDRPRCELVSRQNDQRDPWTKPLLWRRACWRVSPRQVLVVELEADEVVRFEVVYTRTRIRPHDGSCIEPDHITGATQLDVSINSIGR